MDNSNRKCTFCHGTGEVEDNGPKACPQCGGNGFIWNPDEIKKIYWFVSEIAKEVGSDRQTLYNLLKAVGVHGHRTGRNIILNAVERELALEASRLQKMRLYTYKGIKEILKAHCGLPLS